MKKIKYLSFLTIFLVVQSFLNLQSFDKENIQEEKAEVLKKKPWTFLIYAALDNDLYDPWFLINQKQMEDIGSNDNVNILIYLNKPATQEGIKVSQKIIVEKDVSKIVDSIPEQDSGSENALIDAIKWACTHFPSDKFFLILSDHGNGWRERKGVCFDETTHHGITDLKLKKALEVGCQFRDNKKIDALAIDACVMSTMEIVYTALGHADFFIASQDNIPKKGFEYSEILSHLAASNIEPLALAKIIVDEYDKYYKEVSHNYTISALDLNLVSSALSSIHKIIQLSLLALKSNNAFYVKSAFLHCVNSSINFADSDQIDLVYLFYSLLSKTDEMEFKNLSDQSAYECALNAGISSVLKSVIANAHSSNLNLANGISIYFPKILDPFYKNTLWAKDTKWSELISSCLTKD